MPVDGRERRGRGAGKGVFIFSYIYFESVGGVGAGGWMKCGTA